MANDRFLVCVDAGHGGTDSGAVDGREDEEFDDIVSYEKYINVDIARRVVGSLAGKGVYTSETRTTDKYVSLKERVDLANRLGANLFVSIHCNSSLTKTPPYPVGIETFHYPPTQEYTNPNDKLAATLVQENVIKFTGAVSRGVKTEKFYVLTHTKMPAVLIECGFLNNPAEEKLLNDPEYRKKVAQGIAAGILAYREATK